ncbi:arsenic resistance protein [Rhizobium wenxiniae]|uniref:arsenic resistance protein n=1 Tax=Rhizobium wenxiniae TaxID=1737357 RepID=UPI003C182E5B
MAGKRISVNAKDEEPARRTKHVPVRLPAGLGTTLLFVAAIVVGASIGIGSAAAGEFLGSQVDRTVLILVGLLFFEVRFSALTGSGANLRFLSIAWIMNFVFIPTIGFAIASLFLSGDPLFFTGLVIYFMAPCTDWFLGFTRLAKGNTALGSVLLPLNMISQLLLYPVYLHIFANGVAPVEAATIGQTLLQWFVIPCFIAITARLAVERFLPELIVSRLLAGVACVIPFVIALLIVEIFAANISVIVQHMSVFAVMLIAVFVFFVSTYVLGEVVSKLAGFDYPEHALLTITTAARNAPLMLGVTALAMPDQPLIYAAIVIGMLIEFPHLTALRQILLLHRRTTGHRPPALQGSG